MTRKFASLFALMPLAFLLSSCSGLPVQNCGNNCVQNGNANVTLTLFDAPPAGVDFISFNIPITAVTLTPQSGANVTVFSPATPAIFEMTHLQSDSALIGTFQVPSGTYTALHIVVSAPFAKWANSSGSTILGCATNTLCNLAGGAGQIDVPLNPSLSLAANQNIAVGLDFNLDNAVTTQNGLTLDLINQADVVTVATLPRTGQASGTADTIEDFVGVVKTVSGSTITLQNDAGTTFAGTTGSTTTFDPPPGGSPACGGTFNLSCVAVGQTLSVDATVSSTGAIVITNVDFLDLPAVDEIEGTIFPTATAGTFLCVVDHKILAANSTNATILAPVSSGTTLNLVLDTTGTGPTFAIDAGNLPITPSNGFFSSSDLVTGQRVMAHVKSVTSGALLNVTTDRVVLRFSRLTGTPGTVSGNNFALATTPAYFAFVGQPQVETFTTQTIFDGVTDISGLNGITNKVSIRALYLNPGSGVQQPFVAAKVRKH